MTANTPATATVLLTDKRREALRWIVECGLLTVEQLCRLGGYTPKMAYKYVDALRDGGWAVSKTVPVHFVERGSGLSGQSTSASPDEPRKPGREGLRYGRTMLVLMPTKKAVETLFEDGDVPFRRSVAAPSFDNPVRIAHEVEIREFRVLMEEACRALPGAAVSAWRDGADAKAGTAFPDASTAISSPRRQRRYFLEVDRGTERGADKWEKKANDYLDVFTNDPDAALLVTVPDRRRGTWIAQTVRKRHPEVLNRMLVCDWEALRASSPATLTTPVWTLAATGALVSLLPVKDFAGADPAAVGGEYPVQPGRKRGTGRGTGE